MLDSLDMETIENTIEHSKKIQNLGFQSRDHWDEFVESASHGLQLFGDNFLSALGLALELSSTDDAIRIIRMWHQQCEQHSILYKMKLAKEKALNE